ncbi:hypothetical protein [Rhizomonospora bruguierae]|uniref:hypothetical protein n=1 Tax=Rhizomonospora bruguierae TaxID=1581705 RepID=UPI001BD0B343|nr:hypothetical protein [Micromonospora sp. NBRC 107566]
MSSQQPDPAGNTQQFRAFVEQPEPRKDPAEGVKKVAIVGAVIVALAALALVLYVAFV